MTQKDLLFGVYWGKPQSLNPGLSIWFRGRYILPWTRKKGKRSAKSAELPFDQAPHMVIELDESRPLGILKENHGN
jgi:hypothetical protein